MSDDWTIAAVLKWATEDFRGRSIESPRLDAEVLLSRATGLSRTQLVIEMMKPLAPEELARFRDMVKRRRAREPVAYILGEREFYGRTFRVDARVLIPRPDTEALVDVALARSRRVSMSARVLDLCTGSGCVAITLARERPTTHVTASDKSESAIAVAAENATRLGAYNVAFAVRDLFGDLRGPFDLVTANPPYIASAEVEGLSPDIVKFEPRLALDGGAAGDDVVARIVQDAPSRLAAGGVLAVEVGAGQSDRVAAMMAARGFTGVERTRDYGRIERVVSGAWP
ncbi:MAG TPA: peptide chain release factor N(5)-glutamine methyltransferase [Polyangiaceae bacterium]|nr:peptide chain release factor N(5)-glutamine methyltransferase [Polyangiaceae bacterium]